MKAQLVVVDRIGNQVSNVRIPWLLRLRFRLHYMNPRRKQSGLVAYWRQQR